MENHNSQKGRYDFLDTTDSEECFGICDYELRQGRHIQRDHIEQRKIWDYLTNYEADLRDFYGRFFNLSLEVMDQDLNRYYFLDFRRHDSERVAKNPIPGNWRDKLTKPSIIIAVLLWKIIYSDGHIELGTIDQFIKLVQDDYGQTKKDIYRLFAKSRNDNVTGNDDQTIAEFMRKNFKDLDNLAWIHLHEDGNTFDVQSSLNRVFKLYQDEIRNIDKIIAGEQAKP